MVYYICCYWGLNLTTEFNCIVKLDIFKFWLIVKIGDFGSICKIIVIV